MSGSVPRSKLFHTIVVVGLASASAGCGGTGTVVASDGGGDAPGPEASGVVAPDTGAETGFEAGTGFEGTPVDAGVQLDATVAADPPPDCDAGSHSIRCFPTYV